MITPTERAEVLRIQGLAKRFNGRPVLDGIDMSVRDCETVSVLGGSGSGKTTLLKLITGLIKPDRGRIRLFGRDNVPLSEDELLPLRRRIGVVFQGAALFDSLTVLENIAFPLRVHTRTSEAGIRSRAAEVLEQVGLPGTGDRYPAELSGGMKKRIGVARALVLQPDLLLFDEPTAGLDFQNARLICELIGGLRQGLCETSVVVTHDLHCAFAVSSQIVFLHEGRIVEAAAPGDFRNSPRPEVQTFLAGAFN